MDSIKVVYNVELNYVQVVKMGISIYIREVEILGGYNEVVKVIVYRLKENLSHTKN